MFFTRAAVTLATTALLLFENGEKINAQRPPRLPGFCKGTAGNPDTKDRYCEVDGPKPASRCGCQEVCHVWGDPHVEPFFSGCSAITLKVGNYSMLTIPDQIRIWVEVEDYYVRKIFISEGSSRNSMEKWFDSAEDCTDATSFNRGEYTVYTDTGEESLLSISTHCEKPPSRSVYHLNTTIVIDDECHADDGDDDDDDETGEESVATEACQYKNKKGCMKHGCVWNPGMHACQTAEAFADAHSTDPCRGGAVQTGETRHTCRRRIDGCGYDQEQNICYTLDADELVGGDEAENEDVEVATFGNVPQSATRRSFSGAFGACMNPCSQASYDIDGNPVDSVDTLGNSECKDRGNNRIWFWQRVYGKGVCPQREGSWDGLRASCNSECSAFGDPYVTDFFTNMPDTRGCKVGKNCFNVYPDETEETQEMYAIEGKFQALIETDVCQYIVKFTARYINEDGSYSESVYTAEDYCGKEFDGLIAAENRVVLSVPQFVPQGISAKGLSDVKVQNLANDRQVYDSAVGGYNMGTTSTQDYGELNVGGVRAILKCHNTKHKKQFPSKAYWNVCIHRDAVSPGTNAVAAAASGSLSLKNIEATLQSRGHCVLGDYRRGKYAHRDADEIADSVLSSTAVLKQARIPRDFRDVGVPEVEEEEDADSVDVGINP